jgi:hypothetical protein
MRDQQLGAGSPAGLCDRPEQPQPPALQRAEGCKDEGTAWIQFEAERRLLAAERIRPTARNGVAGGRGKSNSALICAICDEGERQSSRLARRNAEPIGPGLDRAALAREQQMRDALAAGDPFHALRRRIVPPAEEWASGSRRGLIGSPQAIENVRQVQMRGEQARGRLDLIAMIASAPIEARCSGPISQSRSVEHAASATVRRMPSGPSAARRCEQLVRACLRRRRADRDRQVGQHAARIASSRMSLRARGGSTRRRATRTRADG